MSQYQGKTAIISGGAEGIGFSIAQALGKQGMNIVLADISEKNLHAAESKLQDAGVPVLAVSLDVAKESQWEQVASATLDRFGKIHMVVNNAGVAGIPGSIDSQSEKAWRWALDVNLMGVMFGAKVMAPHIMSHGEGGWIINVASMAGMGGSPFMGSYTATKSAVVALSEAWYRELKKEGIAVSVLCPAFVQTRIHQSARNMQDDYKEAFESTEVSKQMESIAKNAVENGIDVALVGERVVEALNDKELYIFTHPNYREVVQLRSKLIDEAFARAEQSPIVKHLVGEDIAIP